MTLDEMYEILETQIVQNVETIDVMIAIHGNNEKTLCDVLYAKTGYRNFEQFLEAFWNVTVYYLKYFVYWISCFK